MSNSMFDTIPASPENQEYAKKALQGYAVLLEQIERGEMIIDRRELRGNRDIDNPDIDWYEEQLIERRRAV